MNRAVGWPSCEHVVEYSDWGVANVYNEKIVLHKDLRLPEWKLLHDWMVEHEHQHETNTFFSLSDFWHDLTDGADLLKGQMLVRFMITRPKTWTQLSPISFYEGDFYIDWVHLSLMLFFVLIIAGLAWFTFSFFGGVVTT